MTFNQGIGIVKTRSVGLLKRKKIFLNHPHVYKSQYVLNTLWNLPAHCSHRRVDYQPVAPLYFFLMLSLLFLQLPVITRSCWSFRMPPYYSSISSLLFCRLQIQCLQLPSSVLPLKLKSSILLFLRLVFILLILSPGKFFTLMKILQWYLPSSSHSAFSFLQKGWQIVLLTSGCTKSDVLTPSGWDREGRLFQEDIWEENIFSIFWEGNQKVRG